MYKRAKLSVTRRKTKTIVFFLILFIIANLVLSSISIKNATEQSIDIARKSLGSEVYLSTDMSSLREEFMQNDVIDEDVESSTDKKEQMQNMHQMMDESNATINDVNTLSEISYVSDVKYLFSVTGVESSFSLYEATQTLDENDNDDKMPSDIGKGNNFNNSLQIEAINTFKLEDGYVNGTIELIDGKAFEESDEDTVIISYELATYNDLSVGSEIKVKDSDEEEHTLTVIGIYQNSDSLGFNNNHNLIYINTTTGEKFLSDEEYNDGNYSISSAVFYLDDPENADAFIEEANELITDLQERYLTLDIDNDTYEQMISSIQGVANFSTTILIIVIIASIVIISLMVVNSLKDRNYEIGVLLSLGEKKKKIVGQFIIELILIATISFIISIFTSLIISQKLADVLLENQKQSVETINSSPQGGRGTTFNKDNIQKEEKSMSIGSITGFGVSNSIDEIDVSVTVIDVGLLFVIGYSIIFVSMIIPAIKILNSDPKDILSRKE